MCGNLQNHLRIFGVRLCFAVQGVTAEQLKRDALDQVMTLRLSNKVATGLTVKYMLMLFSAPVVLRIKGCYHSSFRAADSVVEVRRTSGWIAVIASNLELSF